MLVVRVTNQRRARPPVTAALIAVVTGVMAALVMVIGIPAGWLATPAAFADGSSVQAAPVAIAGTPDDGGYWIAGRDGSIANFGDAGFYNSLPGLGVHVSNIVGIAATPTGHGYWLAGADGGIFAFGDAAYYNSLPGLGVHVSNIVGIAATPTGHGYWLAGADGGIFAFGDAAYYNSLPGLGVHVSNIVGITPTPTGHGYWLAGADGGIFAFGDAGFLGGMGGTPLNGPVVGVAATHTGRGYWMTATDGGVFGFGDAPYLGRPSVPSAPPAPDLRTSVVGRAKTELGVGFTEVSHNNCNPYSDFWNRGSTACPAGRRSEAWCADFAGYVWQQAGAKVGWLTASSSSFKSGAPSGTWKALSSGYLPQPGDAVVFGSTHVGVIVAVSSATSVEMISGNYSDAVSATWFNPATFTVGGTPVSGYAQPVS
jgi:CHAP domain